jgi:MFS family permease
MERMPYYRRNLYVLCVTIFLASVSWNQVMPFLPQFLQQMGVKNDLLLKWSGYVFSCQSLASIIALPYWGKLGDRFGRKKMTLRAGFCLACIYFGMSLCHSPYQLALLRFLNGALTGFIPGSMALIATNTPEEQAPKAVATAQTAGAVGQIVGPGIGGILAGWFGYRGSMQVSACAVLASTILVLILVQEKAFKAPKEKTSLVEDFLFAFRSPILTSIMVVMLINSLFLSAMPSLLSIHLRGLDAGISEKWIGIIYSLPAIAFVLSAHLWTIFGERSGQDRAICIGFAGAVLSTLVLGCIRNIWIFSCLFFLFGLFVAVVGPSIGSIICTRVQDSFRGRAYGMQQAAGTLGGLIAPITSTQIAARYGIPSIFIIASPLYLVGIFAFRSLRRRWDSSMSLETATAEDVVRK